MFTLTEEETTTPPGLVKISVFAAAAFLVMALMVEAEARTPVLFAAGFILALLGISGGWLFFRRRYGSAYLVSKTGAITNGVFEGVIETGLRRIPTHPVRIVIADRWWGGGQLDVPPERMRLGPSGNVVIPFSIPLPKPEKGWGQGFVRMYVRTRTWPIGWGATFLLT